MAKKIFKITCYIILAFVIFCFALGIWLYNGPMSDSKIQVFSFLPFPIASVNGKFIPVSEFILRYQIAKTALPKSGISKSASEISGTILNQLINEEEVKLLCSKYKINVSSKEVDEEFKTREASVAEKNNFSSLLEGFGLTEQNYKNEILKPELLQIKLQIWFNSQEQLNTDAYAQAKSLLSKIQSGENFGNLAGSFTQDAASQPTQGDLGYIDPVLLLPEMKEAVATMKTGEIKLIPSRFGLHLIKVEDISLNKYHLMQIFLKCADFKTWYNIETNSYKIKKLIKI